MSTTFHRFSNMVIAAAFVLGSASAGAQEADLGGDDDFFGAEASEGGGSDAAWAQASVDDGKRLFRALCTGCHGVLGDGQGPAADVLVPVPRDLTAGEYRFRSTTSGSLPLRADVMRTLQRGLPGTRMPSWGDQLSEKQMMAVVRYLETLSPRFVDPPADDEILVDAEQVEQMPSSPELLARGEALYDELKCGECHGPNGRGDGLAAPTLKDNDGRKSIVFDFTYGVYKGGYDPIDVYRTFVTGLNGTPMPSFAGSLTEESDRWALVHYCRSLSRSRGLWFYLSELERW